MRIIGGKDYYDAGAAWGQDETVVFMRNGKRGLSSAEVYGSLGVPFISCAGGLVPPEPDTAAARKRALNRYRPLNDIEIGGIRHLQDAGRVLFCGTLYNGVRLARGRPTEHARWFWTYDAMAEFAAEHGLALHEGEEFARDQRETSPVRRQTISYPHRMIPLSRWFDPVQLTGSARDAVVLAGITIASENPDMPYVPGPEHEHLNWAVDQPTLAEMDFAKALDPYTAHQEIAMWVGGVLPAPGPKMVEITDDKVKIAKAGFHHPTSFRRGKGE
ncbi:hypothetical protein ABS767_00915 [Sphingomonas sp. ST-64]|uniref:Uncharacterized protein n=1 Tax=Sphingomonas plantiphila TaxID=3163295 RepID=A0ABW8YHR1_9SPHN